MAISTSDVRRTLKELGGLRFGAENLDTAMKRIVDTTHSLFKVDGAGLMLIDSELALRNVAVSDPRCDTLEDLQIRHGEGPCLDAYEAKELVGSDDLALEHRWPSFSKAAVERDLRAVLASPIPYNQQAVGVVAVFSATARAWSPEGELALVAFRGRNGRGGTAQLRRALAGVGDLIRSRHPLAGGLAGRPEAVADQRCADARQHQPSPEHPEEHHLGSLIRLEIEVSMERP